MSTLDIIKQNEQDMERRVKIGMIRREDADKINKMWRDAYDKAIDKES